MVPTNLAFITRSKTVDVKNIFLERGDLSFEPDNISLHLNVARRFICYFNCILSFLGYLMPNPTFLKNSSGTS